MHSERQLLATRRASRRWVAASALLWATTGLGGALAPAAATPAALAEARTLIGGLALALVVLFRSGTRPFAGIAGLPFVISSAALAAFQWSFFAGVRGAGSAIAALVSAAFAPFAGDVLAAIRARRSPGLGFTLGAALLGAATTALASEPAGRASSASLAGVLAAAGSGIAYALYADTAAQPQRRASRAHVGTGAGSTVGSLDQPDASLAMTGLALLGASAVLAPSASSGVAALVSARGALVTAYLGLIATALAYAAFVRGLRGLAAPEALAILVIQPLAASAIGWLVLEERFDRGRLLATIVLLAAAALRSWRPTAHSLPTQTQEKTP
jgi:DME family drug/metabolite transporter